MNQSPEIRTENTPPAPRRGGLYSRVKVSVKTLDIIIVVLIAALALCVVFMVSHNGFTVTYDTQGGTPVESVRVLHGESVSPETPTREGYRFDGWYLDRDCVYPFDPATETVTDSMTLYAKWVDAALPET